MSSERAPIGVEIAFRRATLEDRDGVLNVWPNLYNGLDYLPFSFNRYVTDPLRVCYVAEQDGEIVGFAIGFVADRETRCVLHAARVKASLQGLNVYKNLSRHLKEEVVRRFPRVTEVTFTSSSLNDALKKPSFWQVHREVLRRHYFVHTVSMKDLETSLSSLLHHVLPGVEPVSESMLAQLLASSDDRLFPGNRLVRNWGAFDMMEDNAELIMKDGTTVFGSKHDDRVTCLSLEINFLVAGGPRSELDIYGSQLDLIVGHVVSFMQRLVNRFADTDARDRHVLLSVDSRVDLAPIERVLSQLGLREGIYPHYDHFTIVAPIDSTSES